MKKRNVDLCLREVLQRSPTDQLEVLLQRELEKEEPQETVVLTILDVLRERDAGQPVPVTETALASWSRFKGQCDADRPTAKPRRWLVRSLAGVAAACLVIFMVPKVLGAENIFQLIARWSDSEFSFGTGDNQPQEYVFQTENADLQRIHDAVVKLGIVQPVVPTWVPEGFEMVEFDVLEQETITRVYASMSSRTGYVSFSIKMEKDSPFLRYAKDNDYVNALEIDGVEHYILSNDGEWVAIWANNDIECSISTSCQEEVLYRILQSIYGTEREKI